nr:isoform 2 of vacuolar-processing enzyme delta-isozyme [Quercus suber]
MPPLNLKPYSSLALSRRTVKTGKFRNRVGIKNRLRSYPTYIARNPGGIRVVQVNPYLYPDQFHDCASVTLQNLKSQQEMKNQYSYQAPRPKNNLRVWLRWAPLLQKQPSAIAGKHKEFFEYGGLKESLINGAELSDGSRSGSQTSMQVPKGFLAVYVGPQLRRFVIPTSYLSMPDFRGLMDMVAEEFGFDHEGGLRIPCEEEDFEKILYRCCANNRKKNNKKLPYDHKHKVLSC